MLEKWQCHDCEKGFLVLEDDVSGKVFCPHCGKSDNVEDVAGQNPEEDLHNVLGCLWPGYNDFDKLAYMYRKGEIGADQLREIVNAHLKGK